jgi:pyrroloquinoline quinone biosynthesis protein E
VAENSLDRFRRLTARLRRPVRLRNWLAARRERRLRPDRMRSLPIGIDLEPTTRCNLRCRLCQRAEGDWPERDLSSEQLDLILDPMPQLEQIKLQGMGEPLLHKGFFDLVRRARRRGIRVLSITNGTTLQSDKHQEQIIASGLDELQISIDGATAETHARWRGGADLDRIVDGLRRLVARRAGAPRPQLGIWCVGNPDNLTELDALVDLAADLHVDTLTYQTHLSVWSQERWRTRLEPWRLDADVARVAGPLAEASERADRTGVALTIYTGNRFTAERPCFWPWESCFVSVEGYVTRCCIASDPRLHHFGRIGDVPFAAIWNSPEYRGFRRAIRENRIPAICRPCYK